VEPVGHNVTGAFHTGVFSAGSFVQKIRMDGAIHFFALAMEPETRALARGLRSRDPEVLESLIGLYEYRLFRYLLYLTGSREASRDFFQETWLRVLARGHQYDGQSKFETWLFAIARHLVIDSSRRKHTESLDELMDPAEPGGPREFPAAAAESPLAKLAGREQAERLGLTLAQMPAVYREVLLLRFQEDLSLEEIAGVVKAPLSTVKSRLYRGLSTARELLEAQPS
jgi:RNA polymerase sigma-70 factor, ECF subfamily